MKITKRQLRKIIREEKKRILREGTPQAAEEKADNALGELMDAYLEQHLDLSGSNREDALEQAYTDLRNFVDGIIQTTKEFEENPNPDYW